MNRRRGHRALALAALAVAAAAAAAAHAPRALASTAAVAAQEERSQVLADPALLPFLSAAGLGFVAAYPGVTVEFDTPAPSMTATEAAATMADGRDPYTVGILTSAEVDTAGASSGDAAVAVSTFPVAVAAYVAVHSAPCLDEDPLVLDASTAGLLMAGGIARWNDTRLAALNPWLAACASAADVPVRRVYSSRRADADSAARVLGDATGHGAGLAWPWDEDEDEESVAPAAESETEAVFEVHATEGSVALVRLAAARTAGTSQTASMLNDAGSVVTAGRATAEASSSEFPDASARMAGPTGGASWPLCAYYAVTVASAQPGGWSAPNYCARAAKMLQLVRWWLTSLQAADLGKDFGVFPPATAAREATLAAFQAAECDARGIDVGEVRVDGRGASFPAAVYQQWAFQFAVTHPGYRIAYTGSGSGSGKRAILAGEVSFAGSDSLLSAEQWAEGGDLSMLPVLAGAVVIVYQAEGAAGALFAPRIVLDRATAAGIFAGTVWSWRDPAILTLNPELAPVLPSANITIVHRSDKSGTTEIFTKGLSSFSDEFRESHGASSLLEWAVDAAGRGVGAQGNRGVSAAVQATPGSFGYVGLDYAVANNMRYAEIVNRAGNAVLPTVESIEGAISDSEAAGGAGDPNGGEGGALVADIVDGAGWESYPLAGYTYLIYRQHTDGDCAEMRSALTFWQWALTDETAHDTAGSLGFATAVGGVRDSILARIDEATCRGTPLVGGCPDGRGISPSLEACEACAPGTASPADSRECAPCAADSWSPGGAGAAECLPCPAHHHQPLEGQDSCVQNDLLELSGAVAVSGVALSVAGVLACAAAAVVTWKNRKHQVIVASTPSFLYVVLLGCALGMATLGVMSAGKSAAGVCAAGPLLASAAFVLIACPLALKTWRLNRIFNSGNLKVRRIRTSRILGAVGAALALEAALHGVRALADPSQPRREPAKGTEHTDVFVCASDHDMVWWFVFLLPKAALLAYVAVLSYKVRNLSAEFNESRSLALSTAIIGFMMVVGLPMMATAEHSPQQEFIVMAGALTFCAAGVVGLVHVSKFWGIYVTHEFSNAASYQGSKTPRNTNGAAYTSQQGATDLGASPAPSPRRATTSASAHKFSSASVGAAARRQRRTTAKSATALSGRDSPRRTTAPALQMSSVRARLSPPGSQLSDATPPASPALEAAAPQRGVQLSPRRGPLEFDDILEESRTSQRSVSRSASLLREADPEAGPSSQPCSPRPGALTALALPAAAGTDNAPEADSDDDSTASGPSLGAPSPPPAADAGSAAPPPPAPAPPALSTTLDAVV